MILNGIINNQISYFKYDIYIYPSLDCISFDIQWRTENFKNFLELLQYVVAKRIRVIK